MSLDDRMEQFLREYRTLTAIAPLQERLKAFLEQARPILRAEAIARHEKPATIPEPDAENLAYILPILRDLLKEARGRGDGLTCLIHDSREVERLAPALPVGA